MILFYLNYNVHESKSEEIFLSFWVSKIRMQFESRRLGWESYHVDRQTTEAYN